MRRLAAVLVTLLALAAGRAEAATVPVSTYCSPSGDLCFGIFRKNGAVHLDLTTVERYFGRYTLCVAPPAGARTCRSFPIRRARAGWASSVRWYRNFPRRGPGRYVVTWKLAAPLGPSRSFRLG